MDDKKINQLIILDTLVYLDGFADIQKGTTLKDRIQDCIDNKKIVSDHMANNTADTSNWEAIFKMAMEMIEDDPSFGKLKLITHNNSHIPSKDIDDVTKTPFRAMAWSDPANPEKAVVIFRGTYGGTDWIDDAKGMYNSETAIQKAGNAWLESLDAKYTDITVSGHSKGGNHSQYNAIMSDRVTEILSIDGQGFGHDFFEKYANEIAANQHKITNISSSTDFVNCLMLPLGNTIFIKSKIDEGSFKGDFLIPHEIADIFGPNAYDNPNNLNIHDRFLNVEVKEPAFFVKFITGLTSFASSIAKGNKTLQSTIETVISQMSPNESLKKDISFDDVKNILRLLSDYTAFLEKSIPNSDSYMKQNENMP